MSAPTVTPITSWGRRLRCKWTSPKTTKECRECGVWLPAGERHVRQGLAGGRDGERRYCADCARAKGLIEG